MPGESLASDGGGEGPRAYAQVGCCLVSVHPFDWTLTLQPLSGARQVLRDLGEHRRYSRQGPCLDGLQNLSGILKITGDLLEVHTVPVARVLQQVLCAAHVSLQFRRIWRVLTGYAS